MKIVARLIRGQSGATRWRINFIREREPRICSFLSITPANRRGQNCQNKGPQYRCEINKVDRERERENETEMEENVTEMGSRDEGTCGPFLKVDFRRPTAAKSEIDCSAITIPCTQPSFGRGITFVSAQYL